MKGLFKGLVSALGDEAGVEFSKEDDNFLSITGDNSYMSVFYNNCPLFSSKTSAEYFNKVVEDCKLVLLEPSFLVKYFSTIEFIQNGDSLLEKVISVLTIFKPSVLLFVNEYDVESGFVKSCCRNPNS